MSDLSARLAALSPEQRELLTRRLGRKAPAPPPVLAIPRRAGPGPWPLTYEQERMWLVQALFPDGAALNVTNTPRFSGPLDLAVLRRTLAELVRRHEPLRTAFVVRDGLPLQHVLPPDVPDLPLVDLSALPSAPREAEFRRVMRERAREPFDLAAGGPLRLTLLRLGDPQNAEHGLVITIHHIAVDWWSFNLLRHELRVLYRDLAAGGPSSLPELAIQFADFAVWQRAWLPEEIRRRDLLGHWRERLAGAPDEAALPVDRPRPPRATFQGARHALILPAALADRLRALAKETGMTPFTLHLAGFAALLAHATPQDDFCIGTPVADRNRPETEPLISYLLNMLVLRLRVGPGLTFRGLLAHAGEVVRDAWSHQDLPFGLLVDALKPPRRLNRMALFQVAYLYVTAETRAGEPLEGVFDPGTARVDLTLVVEDMPDTFLLFFEYSSALFDAATVVRLAAGLEALLAAAAANPDSDLAALPVFTPAERAALRARSAAAEESATADLAPWAPPETLLEKQIAHLWSGLLGVEALGRDDDFFALGGHSLLASRAAALLGVVLAEPAPLGWFFERPTVRALAARLGGTPRIDLIALPPAVAVAEAERFAAQHT
ncbi:MAG TPA: condensation domain-containing protein [Thermoanaerobaculia bacterium]|nr:condensation domain-containing protein [Thermoanaerobaculia bacterium]